MVRFYYVFILLDKINVQEISSSWQKIVHIKETDINNLL